MTRVAIEPSLDSYASNQHRVQYARRARLDN
jgi:hypothetical protein